MVPNDWCLLLCALGILSSQKSVASSQDDKTQDTTTGGETSAELRLIKHLMGHYDGKGTNTRPVLNSSNLVSVKFGLGLIQMDLSEKDSILSLSMWTKYSWTDEYLRWNPDEFGSVTSLRMRQDQIWIPDIMLYNTANVDKESREALLVVNPDGTVNWYPHSIFRSACSVDVTNYPFDIQKCHLMFGSWTYQYSQMDLNVSFPGGFDLSTYESDYKMSSRWDVVNVTATRLALPPHDPDPIVVLVYELYLRRRMVFSTYMFTLPCVFLACLTLVVFSLPPERPDRTALAMNAFGSFMVLLLILVDGAMPTASSVPLLGIYYCFNLIIIMFAIILSSIVVNISRPKPGKSVPKWLSAIGLTVMARFVGLGSLARDIRKSKAALPADRKLGFGPRGNPPSCCCRSTCTKDDQDDARCPDKPLHESLDNMGYKQLPLMDIQETTSQTLSERQYGHLQGNEEITAVGRQASDIRKSLLRIEHSMDERQLSQRREAVLAREWRAIAQVLDRFFFVLYVIMIVLSLVIFFPRPAANYPSGD